MGTTTLYYVKTLERMVCRIILLEFKRLNMKSGYLKLSHARV